MKTFIFIVLSSLIYMSSYAQVDSIKYKVEAATSITTSNKLPFWIVSNKNGIVSDNRTDYISLNLLKNYSKNNISNFDYSFGIELASSYQYSKYAILNQYYASLKYKKIQLIAGAKNTEILYDGLSFVNNSIIMAGNARPYPKIEIGSVDYLNIPYTKAWVSVKGVFSNGWMMDDRFVEDVLLHHKNAYIRIGKKSGFSLEFGVEHYAQWAGKSPNPTYGKMSNSLGSFFKVITAQAGGTSYNELENSLGNHVGQNEIKFNYNSKKFESTFYMRNMNEDRSQDFRKLFTKPFSGEFDIRDINYGLYIKILESKIIRSFLIEYYSTMFQGHIGHHSAETVVGYDSNFENGVYASGWTNYGRGFGIPLNSPTSYDSNKRISFGNNAFKAINIGVKGEFLNIHYRFKGTYHLNYGRVRDENEGKPWTNGMKDSRIYTYSTPQHQQYYVLELIKPEGIIPFDISTSFGLDIGDMYEDNFGVMVKLSKSGFINKLFKR